MSDVGDSVSEMDGGAPEMLAAEYVLGTLEADEVRAAETRLGVDAAFAAEVRAWEARLYPLTGLVAPVAAPAAVWGRVEASIGGAVGAANDNRVARWRAAAIGGFAVAAGLAAFILLRPVPVPLYAVLSPVGSTQAVLVAVAAADGGLRVRPSAAVAVADGKDLQLWALPAGAKAPASLGVLPAGGKVVAGGLAVGTQLLVSLEPKGGSPTGAPTGAVVYGGIVRSAE